MVPKSKATDCTHVSEHHIYQKNIPSWILDIGSVKTFKVCWRCNTYIKTNVTNVVMMKSNKRSNIYISLTASLCNVIWIKRKLLLHETLHYCNTCFTICPLYILNKSKSIGYNKISGVHHSGFLHLLKKKFSGLIMPGILLFCCLTF